MTDIERTPPAEDPEVVPDVDNDPVPEAPADPQTITITEPTLVVPDEQP